MKRALPLLLAGAALALQGCLFSTFLAPESRLQLENGTHQTVAELEAVGPGDTVLLLGDTLAPGERTGARTIDLDGVFRLRILTGDTSCFRSGCARWSDLGERELGGSLRLRLKADRDGLFLEER